MTGPSMSPRLRAALDALPRREKTARELDKCAADRGPMADLWSALAVELRLTDIREAEVLAAHEAEHRAHVEAVDLEVNGPYPPIVGRPADFDPDTQEFKLK